jgi:hypothetical protein
MYNFKKMSKRKNSVSFRHEEFRRDNSSHFETIKRRKQRGQRKFASLDEKELHSEVEEVPHSSATLATLHLDCEIR